MIAPHATVRRGRPLDRERTRCTRAGCLALALATLSLALGLTWPLLFAPLPRASLTVAPALVAR